jgi:hypothetical protein
VGIGPSLVLWRGACPGWLSHVNGGPGSTQILTRHYGAKSRTVSKLANSGTVPTKKVPVVHPLRVIKTPADGVGAQPPHLLTTQMGLWGFIKSSAQNKVVHMKLSLRLNFQFTRNLEGYTVGTTARFQVESIDALAP